MHLLSAAHCRSVDLQLQPRHATYTAHHHRIPLWDLGRRLPYLFGRLLIARYHRHVRYFAAERFKDFAFSIKFMYRRSPALIAGHLHTVCTLKSYFRTLRHLSIAHICFATFIPGNPYVEDSCFSKAAIHLTISRQHHRQSAFRTARHLNMFPGKSNSKRRDWARKLECPVDENANYENTYVCSPSISHK